MRQEKDMYSSDSCSYGSSSCTYSGSSCSNGYQPMNFGSSSDYVLMSDATYSTASGIHQQAGSQSNYLAGFSQPAISTQYCDSHPMTAIYRTTSSPNPSSQVSDNISSDFFDPESFLETYRIPTLFIGKAEQIKEHVEECFEKTLGEKLPDNTIIRICTKDELRQIHEKFDGTWCDGIVGFAINRNNKNRINEIFVKEDSLDKVMVTVGHELGHVLGTKLIGRKEEEKAFAFELAWLDTIKEHNIAGIGNNIIRINPANNGFHDLAFDFVLGLVRQGMRAIDVFKNLVFSSSGL